MAPNSMTEKEMPQHAQGHRRHGGGGQQSDIRRGRRGGVRRRWFVAYSMNRLFS